MIPGLIEYEKALARRSYPNIQQWAVTRYYNHGGRGDARPHKVLVSKFVSNANCRSFVAGMYRTNKLIGIGLA